MTRPATTAGAGHMALVDWFDDSKVGDQGRPRMVFHGSHRAFKQFKGHIMWFAERSGLAAIYSMGEHSYRTGSHIMPAYLRVRRPLDLVRLGITADDYLTYAEFASRTGISVPAPVERGPGDARAVEVHQILNSPEFARIAACAGYDGIKVTEHDSSSDARRRGNPDTVTWAVFSGEQIMSAIGRAGQYTPSDADSVRAPEQVAYDADDDLVYEQESFAAPAAGG